MTLVVWVALTLAGGLGALARYFVDGFIAFREHEQFPYGILAVNVSGAFALGFLTGLTSDSPVLQVTELGFLGAFTTFSTWMLDTYELARDGRHRAGALNIGVSLVLGLGAAALGRAVATAF